MDWCCIHLTLVASEYIFSNTIVVIFYTCLHTWYTHISCNNHGFLYFWCNWSQLTQTHFKLYPCIWTMMQYWPFKLELELTCGLFLVLDLTQHWIRVTLNFQVFISIHLCQLWVVFMVVFLTLFSFKVLRLCLLPPDVFVTCCPLYPSTICAKYGQIYKDQYLTRIIL